MIARFANQSVRPFQRLYIDLLGPYHRSKSGFIGLLIVLDHFSKYHWLCPLRKFSSVAIKDFLLGQIFHVYGIPETIVSDDGSQFKANDLKAFLLHMTLIMCTPHIIHHKLTLRNG